MRKNNKRGMLRTVIDETCCIVHGSYYMREIELKELWAKSDPRKELICHLKETGIVCKVILEYGSFSRVKDELLRSRKMSSMLSISKHEGEYIGCRIEISVE